MLSRAVHLARPEFPFLADVRAATVPHECLEGLNKCMQSVDEEEVARGLVTVLSRLVDLLVGFLGEDLVVRLVRSVWPDLPWCEPHPAGYSDGPKAGS
jgi:hypothetical protein